MKVSQKFITAVKANSKPAYQIAWAAGLHPSILSKLMHGIERVKSNDPRVIAVGRVLMLTAEECFEEYDHGK